MCGAILKATHNSIQKGMTFCPSIYMKKVMKLLAFIFEQPSYIVSIRNKNIAKKISHLISIKCIQNLVSTLACIVSLRI